MDLRQLRTFQEVARQGSFRRAAEALNYAQSTVSAQIQALEDDLGVRLFERLPRSIRLTRAGETLQPHAANLLEMAERAQAEVRGETEPEGRLSIIAAETLCSYRLPRVLELFRQRYPKVEVIFGPDHYRRLHERIETADVDLAFVICREISCERLLSEPLTREELLVVARPDHPLAGCEGVRCPDLTGETLILTEQGCSYRVLWEHALENAGVTPGAKLEFNSIEAIKRCVEAGLGVALLPEVAVERELAAGTLTRLDWIEEEYRMTTRMVVHRDRWRSPAIIAFMETAREVLGAQERLRKETEEAA